MKVLLQKVSNACVTVDNAVIGDIAQGYLLFLGVLEGDKESYADWLAQKVLHVRLFPSDDGKINDRSILDIGGEILVVSQFTLAGNLSKGNRPDYTAAAKSDEARKLYEYFCQHFRNAGVQVATGEFGAMMDVSLVNDGPVTLLISRDT